jgi:RNA polymerase sigma-70 factor (ECF subfamily)
VGAFHRAAKRDVRSDIGAERLEHTSDSGLSGDAESLNILRMVIDEVLSNLSATNREIVKLRIEGYEVEVIAEQIGRSKRTVERILQEFRKTLSTLIREDES